MQTLRTNPTTLYSSVFVMYYAAFQRYLLIRRGAYLRQTGRTAYSPLIHGCEHLGHSTAYPLPLDVLLRADAIRMLRNLLAHGEALPTSRNDVRIERWRHHIEQMLHQTVWRTQAESALDQVLGHVFHRVWRSSAKKKLPRELILLFYAFASLSALAVAAEEALYDPAVDGTQYTIRRIAKHIRRKDLVIGAEV